MTSLPHRKWLIIGPAEYDLPCMHWQLEALAFFDHLLHGADNGYARQPAVRYFTDGTGDYRTATDFPIPGSETVRLYPAALRREAGKIDAFLAELRNVVAAGIRRDGRPHLSPNWFYWNGQRFLV